MTMMTTIDFEGLARGANRAGRPGREALAVLQDAVLESFGPAFEINAALARDVGARPHSAERLVIFYPFQAPVGVRSSIAGFEPPFDIATEAQLAERPAIGAVVWSDRTGFDVQPQQGRWRATDRARRALERARPTVILDVERIRLDAGGYDSRGRYFGSGQPLFRVTSREPLPIEAFLGPFREGAYGTRRFGYSATEGFWIDTEPFRAPDARTARQRVAKELGINARSR